MTMHSYLYYSILDPTLHTRFIYADLFNINLGALTHNPTRIRAEVVPASLRRRRCTSQAPDPSRGHARQLKMAALGIILRHMYQYT